MALSRARVEHVYASLQQMGGKGLQCIGLERAVLQLNRFSNAIAWSMT